MLIFIDVSGLYKNIQQVEGLQKVGEALEVEKKLQVTADLILKLLELVLNSIASSF